MAYRIIYRLQVRLEQLPTDPPRGSTFIYLELDRNGINGGRSKPRHKARAIDLRVGDEIMVNKCWRRIIDIKCQSDNYMSDEAAANRRADDDHGYAYKLKDETRTAEQLRAERHDRLSASDAASPT
jgi:hypothetical protein